MFPKCHQIIENWHQNEGDLDLENVQRTTFLNMQNYA